MAFVWTTAGRNAKCTTGIGPACASGSLKFYTTEHAALLASVPLGATAFGTPVDGVITAIGFPKTFTPTGSGKCEEFDLCQSNGTVLASGTVTDTDGDGDIKFSNVAFATTASVVLSSVVHREGVGSAPVQVDGWTDLTQYLVTSSGSHSLGSNTGYPGNATRDTGSKIVYFNSSTGDNATAGAYWWNGTNLVDVNGSTTNPSNGLTYGTDPLNPNESAIMPFLNMIGTLGWSGTITSGDVRLRTNLYDPSAVSGGFPDWFLFRRGQTFTTFDNRLYGGRSESEPTVITAYGPIEDGRATFAPVVGETVTYGGVNRLTVSPFERPSGDELYCHMVVTSIRMNCNMDMYPLQETISLSGGPTTLEMEDVAWNDHLVPHYVGMVYLPRKTTIRRSIIAYFDGYYTHGSVCSVTFDRTCHYRAGYTNPPMSVPDPGVNQLNRNIYEGGGAQMGHTYLSIWDVEGASGSPQIRHGGHIENSAIINGYWYSSTFSNDPINEWIAATNQTGQSALTKNNVQFIYTFPSVGDPDSSGQTPGIAQPGWGYLLEGASFGAEVSGNIISNAMMIDELEQSRGPGDNFGLNLVPEPLEYQDSIVYTHKNNTIHGNIVYATQIGLSLTNDWAGTVGDDVHDNVFCADSAIDAHNSTNLTSSTQLTIANNRFYVSDTLPSAAYIGTGNTVAAQSSADTAEGWPDPRRTLKRYVTEVLGLTLLTWSDDPRLGGQSDSGAYDPTGTKTMMAVVTNMRMGGTVPIPSSGKPVWGATVNGQWVPTDYAWDERFEAKAFVNWIRAGFGLSAV